MRRQTLNHKKLQRHVNNLVPNFGQTENSQENNLRINYYQSKSLKLNQTVKFYQNEIFQNDDPE